MPVGGHWPYLKWPYGGPDGCLYDSGALKRPARRSAVRVPGSPTVDAAPTLAPTWRRRTKHVDAGHHTFPEFIPEHLQQACTQQSQLGCPCRGVATDMKCGGGKSFRVAVVC